MTKLIPEGLCKQIIHQFERRTNKYARGGPEKPRVVLRELMQALYSQAYAQGQAAERRGQE
jgi:hypothetical protein